MNIPPPPPLPNTTYAAPQPPPAPPLPIPSNPGADNSIPLPRRSVSAAAPSRPKRQRTDAVSGSNCAEKKQRIIHTQAKDPQIPPPPPLPPSKTEVADKSVKLSKPEVSTAAPSSPNRQRAPQGTRDPFQTPPRKPSKSSLKRRNPLSPVQEEASSTSDKRRRVTIREEKSTIRHLDPNDKEALEKKNRWRGIIIKNVEAEIMARAMEEMRDPGCRAAMAPSTSTLEKLTESEKVILLDRHLRFQRDVKSGRFRRIFRSQQEIAEAELNGAPIVDKIEMTGDRLARSYTSLIAAEILR